VSNDFSAVTGIEPKWAVDIECDAIVVGGGPAGLMAADVLSSQGFHVHVFDRMPSVGRKFLLAGKGGLNLTHAEPFESFLGRFGAAQAALTPMLTSFDPGAVRAWAAALGVETFVGTSGRVFPVDMKAAPLLRAWLRQMREPSAERMPVTFHQRHCWTGWDADGAMSFQIPGGATVRAKGRVVVLALGGGSWPQLGSDGSWAPVLASAGVPVAPLRPSNCGFDVAGGWTPHFAGRFAGSPLKLVSVRVRAGFSHPNADSDGVTSPTELAPCVFERKGECVITQTGIEGSVVYAASACLRDQIEAFGQATLEVDLLPDWTHEKVGAAVSAPRGSRSLSSHLKSRLGLDGVKAGLLYEQLGSDGMHQPKLLAEAIKSVRLPLCAPRPVAEAISSAGGVSLSALTSQGMVTPLPGVFCAGEMLDWEAPTGGYLLTACLATGRWTGVAAANYLRADSMS
jgi:uncharacterized flavoprotein (TIGR03862 family)